MSKIVHTPNITFVRPNVRVKIDLSKYGARLKKAQRELDTAVMNSMLPFMPLNTGDFQRRTRAESTAMAGSGKVVAAAAPFGRYLYFGKVMVDSRTGKGPALIPNVGFRFRKGAKLVATSRPLTYSNPQARSEWFEVAKQRNLRAWQKVVGDTVKGKK